MVIYVTWLEIVAVFHSNRKMGYICSVWGKKNTNEVEVCKHLNYRETELR